jgi:WS/DGAT/MGAT family acyltransferase
MSAVDHAWYRMDSPTNLMMVNAIMWTDEPLDWDMVRSHVGDLMLDRFPKFTQRPVGSALPFGRASWEDDPDFDPDRHLIHHRLADPGDRRALEAYVSAQVPVPLDPAHPLWQVHLIDGYRTGSAVLFRMHHSIADGITLTRVLLSLTASESAHAGFSPPSPDRSALRQVVDSATGLAGQGLRTVRSPGRLLGATTTTVRGARRLLHLATLPPKPRSALAGPVGGDKQVRWTEDWALDDIRGIKRSAGVTINDVLLSVLADALGRYLVEEGTPLDSVRVMVPVNLRPLDQPLGSDLGNVFGEYVVTLPTGPMTPLARLARMHDNVEELKGSPEAVVAYLTLVAIGWMPDPVEDLSTRLFSAKVVATVSNVPGPRTAVTLAGTPVSGIIGWVPGAGDVGLGVSMFSYNGRVLIGLTADTTLIPDLDRLTAHLAASLADLADSCGVELSSS